MYKVLERIKRKYFVTLISVFMIFNILAYRIDAYFFALPLPQIFYIVYNMIALPYLYVFMIGCYIYKYRNFVLEKMCSIQVIVVMGFLFCIWKIFYTYTDKIAFGKFYNPITTLLLSVLIFGIGYKITLHLKIDLSYGIYIWHGIFIKSLVNLGRTGVSALFVVILGSLLMAVISYFLIELPMTKMKNRNWRIKKLILKM